MSSPVLFQEENISVTPGWFTHAGTSYAMRTVLRISMVDCTQPRRSWRALFFSTLPLVLLTALTLWRERVPWWLAFGLFVGSIVLSLTAARFAFVVRDQRRLEVLLSDGTLVVVQRPGRAFLDRVHAALLQAMDWHHGTGHQVPVAGPAAGSAGGSAGEPADVATAAPVAALVSRQATIS